MDEDDMDNVTATPATSAAAPPDRPGARLASTRVGQGEPLVLLDGQGLSRRSWDPVVRLLADHFDIIAVDLPGHGDSPRQPEGRGNTPADQARAVAETARRTGAGVRARRGQQRRRLGRAGTGAVGMGPNRHGAVAGWPVGPAGAPVHPRGDASVAAERTTGPRAGTPIR
jgi:hypothetical protein